MGAIQANSAQLIQELILSKPQFAIYKSTQQVNLFMGGQGCGKTLVAGVLTGRFISQFPKVRGLIAANTYQQLTRSTMYRIREVWKQYCNLVEYDEKTGKGDYVVGKKPPQHFDTEGHNFDKYDGIISFSWGTVVYTGSLDNYKSLDGMEVAWMILDETKDTREDALNEVLFGRLRQSGMYVEDGNLTNSPTSETGSENKPFLPLYVFTSPAKVPWLNKKFNLDDHEAEIRSKIYYPPQFFKKETASNQLAVIGSVHLNKKNLPATYIQNQEANIPADRQGMLIYGDPFAKTGGEFVKFFSSEKHVGKVAHTYHPEEVLHLTFDFNSVPYITCLAYQLTGKAVRQIGNFCLESPHNSTPALCEFLNKHFAGQIAKVFIYGDPSGQSKNKGTTTKEKASDFDIIFKTLSFKTVNKVQKGAPSVSTSRDFLDLILSIEYAGISLVIDEKCTKTLDDLKYTKEASDGTMEKVRVRDSNTGIMYEPYGHCTDAKRYFFVSAFEKEYRLMRGKGSSKLETTARLSDDNKF
jgi:hypothetical protein